ncbi:MAG: hypothetical protein PWP23_652 [Candidatus Sumerlaeota bacterium]|nr:hypothetical protein [Candidatus Sumerlaeota bacterium]
MNHKHLDIDMQQLKATPTATAATKMAAKSDLADFLLGEKYKGYADKIPSVWTAEEVANFCDELLDALRSIKPRRTRAIYAGCVAAGSEPKRELHAFSVQTARPETKQAPIEEQIRRTLGNKLDSTKRWKVYPWYLSLPQKGGEKSIVEAVDIVRSALQSKNLKSNVSSNDPRQNRINREGPTKDRDGQGHLDPSERKVVEEKAVEIAIRYLEKNGFTDIKSREKDRVGYDFDALWKSRKCCIEVKGTTTGGESVVLTENEVRFAKTVSMESDPPLLVLIVVTGIALSRGESPRASEVASTRTVVKRPWDIDEDGTLSPIQYRYFLEHDVPGN